MLRYDPLANTSKALEEIGAKLQRQYETWQPRARYKQSLDPTVDDIRKVGYEMKYFTLRTLFPSAQLHVEMNFL